MLRGFLEYEIAKYGKLKYYEHQGFSMAFGLLVYVPRPHSATLTHVVSPTDFRTTHGSEGCRFGHEFLRLTLNRCC